MGLIDKVETPNPNEMALRVWVPSERIVPEHMPTSGTTTYRDFQMHPTPNMAEGYADYVYTYVSGSRQDPDTGQVFLAFHFAENKTDEEKWTPYQSIPRFHDYPWDDITLDVRPVPDLTAVRSGVTVYNGQQGVYTSPSWNLAITRVTGGMRGTRIVRHKFTAPTQFTPPRYPAPVPLPMHILMPNGESYDIPPSLHEELELEPMASAQQSLVNGVSYGTAGVVRRQVFGETNQTTWRRRVIEFQQTQENGVWSAWMDVAYSPPLPEPETITR